MLFGPGQMILFIGDSITDAGRRGRDAPYGNGYVSLVRNFLLARYPDLHLIVINQGISGNTTRDLRARWERDVLTRRPDWLSLKIGINDVWRSFGSNRREAVPLPEYTANLRHLLDATRAHTTARVILLTPYMIEPDRAQRRVEGEQHRAEHEHVDDEEGAGEDRGAKALAQLLHQDRAQLVADPARDGRERAH